ncbi:1-aminocyclopropane-1-carboxylate synthase [Verticillium alfalfae VaMs.102]|uniref:1-aminocyclopropane-1-carboxylate synthase n=1 Tax=Verticillium alfalfae (strain VaMs.102 / ATCC MYA-4576 / FGSC 10136) TaxID=526221 RepID=C9SSQ5_VERA1|nr:1-aminocyclopropane-1-carboxylate synthase [Verticillium alfalfae VaMs.102]EEY21820.1 1-aminocyclopropane-1-carboxylate synthase [Verticillium alfalfae VaMs.102]
MARPGRLSARGDIHAEPASRPPMLDVVCDLWHPESNPGGYLSLGVAENTLMHKEMIEYMKKTFNIESHFLTYGDGFTGSHLLREVAANFINERFRPVNQVLKKHVSITSGVGPALELSSFSLCDPGDGILLGRPYYGTFPIAVSFGEVDPLSEEAIPFYEQALLDAKERGITTKALILCNPHNPLAHRSGRCYPRSVIEGYMRLCQTYSLHLLSDEIYALSIWDNPDAADAPGFTSALSIDTTNLIDSDLVHVLWGMSKVETFGNWRPIFKLTKWQDFGSNGIRLGCIISTNEPFQQAVEANAYWTCPSALTDQATAKILADTAFVDSYVATNQARLAASYAVTTRFLRENDVPYEKGRQCRLLRVDRSVRVDEEERRDQLSEAELWGSGRPSCRRPC